MSKITITVDVAEVNERALRRLGINLEALVQDAMLLTGRRATDVAHQVEITKAAGE
jgi:Flp pilus assembly secretin CpaC